MSEVPTTYLTAEEYLALERASESKNEYRDGQMVAMPGGSYEHSLIIVNLIQAIGRHLRRPYKVLSSDMRVLVPAVGLYTYADVVVLRGEPTLSDRHRDNLTNPAVIIEVLSPSTESYDRGRKFRQYQGLDSLQEYILVSQDRPKVEQFLRQDDREHWLPTVVTDLSASIVLPSIGCQLALADIYDQVRFKT
ncbi:MAG TPA: Uma2 family endonuclease [Thermoanaerobaculia bacterium]|jgi:Uma2 family endonuclease|nr:Uma2 family endonuclease [Thermoanaerobaculia bacterium]